MSRKQQGMFTVCIMAFLIMVSGLYGSFFSHNSEVMPMGQIGGVFRAVDGTGLEDVRIDVYLQQAQVRSLHTGPLGEYSIKSLVPGIYSLEFQLPGAESIRQDVRVHPARNSFCNVRMESSPSIAFMLTIPIIPVEHSSLDMLMPQPVPVSGAYAAPYMPPVLPEAFLPVSSMPFYDVSAKPLTDVSVNVNTAYFSYLRRLLSAGRLPNPNAPRVDEMLAYMQPDISGSSADAFTVATQIMRHPYDPDRSFLYVGMKSPVLNTEKANPRNLYVVLDCSGRMGTEDKLYLAKESLRCFIEQMNQDTRLTIICARQDPLVISVDGKDKASAYLALDKISASGSGNVIDALQLALQQAIKLEHNGTAQLEHGIFPNTLSVPMYGEMWLFSDGFYSEQILQDMASTLALAHKQGILCTILGLGLDLYQDNNLYKVSGESSARYIYVDSLKEFQHQLQAGLLKYVPLTTQDLQLKFDFSGSSITRYRQIAVSGMDESSATSSASFTPNMLTSGQSISALFEIELPDTADIQSDSAGKLMLYYHSPHSAKPRYEEYDPSLTASAEAQQDMRDYVFTALFAKLLRDEVDVDGLSWHSLWDYVQNYASDSELKFMIQTATELQP